MCAVRYSPSLVLLNAVRSRRLGKTFVVSNTEVGISRMTKVIGIQTSNKVRLRTTVDTIV